MSRPIGPSRRLQVTPHSHPVTARLAAVSDSLPSSDSHPGQAFTVHLPHWHSVQQGSAARDAQCTPALPACMGIESDPHACSGQVVIQVQRCVAPAVPVPSCAAAGSWLRLGLRDAGGQSLDASPPARRSGGSACRQVEAPPVRAVAGPSNRPIRPAEPVGWHHVEQSCQFSCASGVKLPAQSICCQASGVTLSAFNFFASSQ